MSLFFFSCYFCFHINSSFEALLSLFGWMVADLVVGRMRIAALVPNGDPHKAGDWAVFRVPETQITRPADFAAAE